jgi:hypothetical protein
MSQERRTIRQGQFYFIYEGNDNTDLILEDKTKRGLEVREHTIDENYGVEVEVDKGMIYDMDGVGHSVGIRWNFPKAKYTLEHVTKIAEQLEARYKALRELTCPEDDDN